LFLPSTSTSEDLYIYGNEFSKLHWNDNLENTRWFELLRLFTPVKNLYPSISKEFTKHVQVAPALQELVVVGGTTQVLPNLQYLFLESSRRSRKASSSLLPPVALSRWEGKEQQDLPPSILFRTCYFIPGHQLRYFFPHDYDLIPSDGYMLYRGVLYLCLWLSLPGSMLFTMEHARDATNIKSSNTTKCLLLSEVLSTFAPNAQICTGGTAIP
jgi:hypothetical protein